MPFSVVGRKIFGIIYFSLVLLIFPIFYQSNLFEYQEPKYYENLTTRLFYIIPKIFIQILFLFSYFSPLK